jgi:hypothetical protein
VPVYTWLDHQRTSYGFGCSFSLVLVRLVHALGRGRGAAWWLSYVWSTTSGGGSSFSQVIALELLGCRRAQEAADQRVSWGGGDGLKAHCHNFRRWKPSLPPVSSLYDFSSQEHFTQYFKQNQYTFVLCPWR